MHADQVDIGAFRERVWEHYHAHGRHDLPWRQTHDPYEVLVSEVMLQQTQVSRVISKYEAWLAEFPTVDALAAAPLDAVLWRWQGLGYNRRAIALKRSAEVISREYAGAVPREIATLKRLPGIGPATAAGVLVFAFGEPAPYLETNVRAVYLHEFFGDRDGVPDREILPLVEVTIDRTNPRDWFYALLDYGWWLKREHPNPSRRSAHHAKQSRFEGSRRQKRARLLRAVMAAPGRSATELGAELDPTLSPAEATELLEELAGEGFLAFEREGWVVA